MLKSLFATAAIAAALSTSAHAQTKSLGMADVEQKLRAAGYTQIHEIERDDGLWEADVSRADGRFAEVWVDPVTGEIFDEQDGRALLDSQQILSRAAAAGLRDIHSLERDGATWSLEARNARNQRVEVRMSGIDGRILHSERDGWLD
ncbi:hypothetical protein ABB26_17255 [Stenotrophomonas humi]|uniref:PepSY domain-containing protein n=1 Tax=Stenotrophomonas humi TaxID=405444 RepID=A0A0R0BWU5_9GAMM|nr:PepSY domain-containing protein [Stenotrophomonas humi]KRG62031.1 hypothetical protein ABB26_17255 [Stenotrophomonas humi]